MFSKRDILRIASTQLALDYNCQSTDFEGKENTIVEYKPVAGRRIYESDGCLFKAVCFGGRAVISTSIDMIPWCKEKLFRSEAAWLFAYPKLKVIDRKLKEFEHEIADVHHYYLPNPDVKEVKPVADIKWYEYEDIFQFKEDERFNEAFAFDENRPDVLAVAAFDGSKLMGMAGGSADSETMWQIGIDVMPEYRSRGVGTNLVDLLKNEILRRGKVPFYGTAISHIHSQNIAVNAGFFPGWAELFSREIREK